MFAVLVPRDSPVLVSVVFFPLSLSVVVNVLCLDVMDPNGELFFRHFSVFVAVHFFDEEHQLVARFLVRQIVESLELVLPQS